MCEYPQAHRLDLTESLLGYQIADPYRWLEETDTEQSGHWLAAQQALWQQRAAELPGREAFAARVAELLHVGEVGTPAWRGELAFFTRRDPGREHSVLYVADGQRERSLVDPEAIDPSGRTTLDAWQPDKEGRLLAYQLSRGGDEEAQLHVLDVATGAEVDGPIDRVRYSGVAWLPGGKAFYYVRRLPPEQVPADETQFHRRIYLHTVGTPAAADADIFGAGRDKTTYYGVSVSRDGRWLTVTASIGTAPRNDVWLADLRSGDPTAPALRPVITGRDARTYPHIGRDGRMYVYTDLDAPRGRIAVADPSAPEPENWRDLVPEAASAVLSDYAILDALAEPVMLLCWSDHAISEVSVHSLASGDRLDEVRLPGLGTVGGLAERPEGGHECWFSYTDYHTPAVILCFDGRSKVTRTWASPPGYTERAGISATQQSYASADGTRVRMMVISAGTSDKPRPTILYGYGGFDISLTPAYSAAIMAWVEAGGVYAVAGLRGGSEEGEQWHRAGMLDRKQNVFDDFRAAAEHLIKTGVTTPGQLAVHGGSNGGLLVGAAVTQFPSLFASAVCSAPLLDMVRYERFGLGQTWNTEYGTAADAEQLGWLLGYSPYHHVADGTAYPAVLFTVFTNDTRVDPVHAYKMCAALQHATASRRPVLLRAEAQVGHGARAVRFTAALSGDTLAFSAQQTGLAPPPG